MFERTERWQVRKAAVVTRGGVVTSQHWRAAEAGAGVLRQGGNAVDAAVATALALAACEPWMSGLAATGYLVVRQPDGACHTVAFPARSPLGLDPGRYPLAPVQAQTAHGLPNVLDDRNVLGWEAVCTPGAVAGLGLAAAAFGRLEWDRLIAPAIDLAARGLAVDWPATLTIAATHADLSRDPVAARVFLPGGSPPLPETHLPNPALLDSLRLLAEDGPLSFYTGRLAERLLADLAEGGSAIRAGDLSRYAATVEAPQTGPIPGGRLHVPAGTSGGQRLLDALAPMAGRQLDAAGYAAMATALRHAYDRHRARMGIPEPASGCTTHVNVVDAEGRMVALTFTLLARFGARVMGPRTGILMNNAMGWFDPRPGRAGSIGPDKVAFSNMSPGIAEDAAGAAWFAFGASGGNQIVPALAQIAWFLGCGLGAEAAMHHPRIETGLGSAVRAMPDLAPGILAHLRADFDVTVTQNTVFPRLYASPSVILAGPHGAEAMAEVGLPSAGMAAA